MTTGTWVVRTVDGAHVRLRSGSAGMIRIDVRAPVCGGELVLADDQARLSLRLALDQLRTGNFLLQAAARRVVGKYDAQILAFAGVGPVGSPMRVRGHAAAGTIDVELDLVVTPAGSAADPLAEVDIGGSANLGTVHLPLPGMGTVEDFSFDVEARLELQAREPRDG